MISYHICLVFSKIIPVAFAPPEHVSLDKSLIEIKKGFFLKKCSKGNICFIWRWSSGLSPNILWGYSSGYCTQEVVFNLKVPICLWCSSLLNKQWHWFHLLIPSVLRHSLFNFQVSYIAGEWPVFQGADIWIYLIN